MHLFSKNNIFACCLASILSWISSAERKCERYYAVVNSLSITFALFLFWIKFTWLDELAEFNWNIPVNDDCRIVTIFLCLLLTACSFSIMVSMPDCWSVVWGFKTHRNLFRWQFFCHLISWIQWIFWFKIEKTQLIDFRLYWLRFFHKPEPHIQRLWAFDVFTSSENNRTLDENNNSEGRS